jgi:hypothetical protein
MRIHGFFSKPKGVREQEILGNTGFIDINNDIMTILCNIVQSWPLFYDHMTVHRNRFLVNKTNR